MANGFRGLVELNKEIARVCAAGEKECNGIGQLHVHHVMKQVKRLPVHFQLKGLDVQADKPAGNLSNSLGSAFMCRRISLKVKDNRASNFLFPLQRLVGEPVAVPANNPLDCCR